MERSICQCVMNGNLKIDVSTAQIRGYRMASTFQKCPPFPITNPSLTPKSWLYQFPCFSLSFYYPNICFDCFLTLFKWTLPTYILLPGILCEIHLYHYDDPCFPHFHSCVITTIYSSIYCWWKFELLSISNFLQLRTCLYMFLGVHMICFLDVCRGVKLLGQRMCIFNFRRQCQLFFVVVVVVVICTILDSRAM